jgi:hypothetical protein
MRVRNEEASSLGIHQQSRFLKQAEQFEDDHDNDNYPDYVKDASVHAETVIRVDMP